VKKWRCSVCGYVYDPAAGDPDNGVPGGTAFEDVSETWVCPVCGVGKDLFEPVNGDESEAGNTGGQPAAAGADRPVAEMGKNDPKAMQSALFKISYGLFVVTSVKGDRVNGQAANTVFQVTSDPMRIALGINKANLTHEFITESGVVGITILGEDGHDLVRRFGYSSGRDKDKFAGLEYVRGATGVPLVTGGIAFIEGRILRDQTVDVGTHTLFVAEVVEGAVIKDTEPMTYTYFRKTK